MPIVGHEKVCLSRLCVRTDREEALVVSKIYREVGENIQYIGAFNPTVVARYSLGAVGLESRTVDCVRQARTGWAVAGRTDSAGSGTPAAPQQRQTDPTLCTDPIRG
jgi:hypothetical protein